MAAFFPAQMTRDEGCYKIVITDSGLNTCSVDSGWDKLGISPVDKSPMYLHNAHIQPSKGGSGNEIRPFSVDKPVDSVDRMHVCLTFSLPAYASCTGHRIPGQAGLCRRILMSVPCKIFRRARWHSYKTLWIFIGTCRRICIAEPTKRALSVHACGSPANLLYFC